jgi:hypothetical protein
MSAGFAIPRQRPLDEPRPVLRALTEDDLVRSYAPPVLVPVPCACGTDVAYALDEPVPLVVARHAATIAHLAWRAQQEP